MNRLKRTLKYTFIHPRGLASRALYAALAGLAPAAYGTLLDLGCGQKPYAGLFAPYVTQHVGMDMPASIHGRDALDLIGSALSLPIVSSSCNTVLATEVMEHVPDPDRMLAEIYRVLAPGGVLILSVPLHEPLHELPWDYYRFTPNALEYLLSRNGLTVERVERRGGAIAVVAYLLCAFLYRAYGATGYPNALTMRPMAGPVVVAVCSLIQIVAASLDRQVRDDFDTIGYAVLARKIK